MVLGVQEGHLAADQLGVRTRTARRLGKTHLGLHLGDSVGAVDTDLVASLEWQQGEQVRSHFGNTP